MNPVESRCIEVIKIQHILLHQHNCSRLLLIILAVMALIIEQTSLLLQQQQHSKAEENKECESRRIDEEEA